MAEQSPDSSQLTAETGQRQEPGVEDAFERIVDEGRQRLRRPLVPLLATGFLGGIDVGVGVIIYLYVKHDTGNSLLASLAFTVGFVALLMANSELFTENFLVPVASVVARKGTVLELLRLWTVTLAANLVGGFVMAGSIVIAFPGLRQTAIETGDHFAKLGFTWKALFLAVLAGAVITLMTRMQNATESLGVKIVPAILVSFVLVGAQLFHSVLDSILMFTGLLTGAATYSYLDWLSALGVSVFGNLLGGLVLVTSVRLLRVEHRIEEERAEAES